jgi:hypothetical protein
MTPATIIFWTLVSVTNLHGGVSISQVGMYGNQDSCELVRAKVMQLANKARNTAVVETACVQIIERKGLALHTRQEGM